MQIISQKKKIQQLVGVSYPLTALGVKNEL